MMITKEAFQVSLWCYFLLLLGAFIGTLGPTLLDLQVLFKVNHTEMSYLFLALGLALGTGCLLSMIVLKLLDANLALMVCMLAGAASTPLVALTPHLYVGCATIGVTGIVLACGFNCVIHQCNHTFPDNASVMHGMLIATSVGSITAPLLAEPFLGHRRNNVSVPGSSLPSSPMTDPSHYSLSTQASQTSDSLAEDNSNSSARIVTTLPAHIMLHWFHEDPTTNMTSKCEKSQVHIVYMIQGLLSLAASVGFMALSVLNRRCEEGHTTPSTISGYSELDKPHTNVSCVFAIFLIMLIITFMSFGGLPYAYTAYLTTYGVDGSLHIDIQRMASMTSAFWLAFLLGRILGTALSVYLKQYILVYICIVGTLLSAVIIALTGSRNEVWLWVGSMPLAVFTAPLLASSLSWCRTCVPLTPLVLGVCTIGDASGAALMPYITGQIIGHFGLEWYSKSILIEASFQIGAFVVLTLLVKRLRGDMNLE